MRPKKFFVNRDSTLFSTWMGTDHSSVELDDEASVRVQNPGGDGMGGGFTLNEYSWAKKKYVYKLTFLLPDFFIHVLSFDYSNDFVLTYPDWSCPRCRFSLHLVKKET